MRLRTSAEPLGPVPWFPEKGMMEREESELYDTGAVSVDFHLGITGLVFFQKPVGVGGKTYADTNMVHPGFLPQSVNFVVTGVRVESETVSRNVLAFRPLRAAGSFTFALGSKEVWKYPTDIGMTVVTPVLIPPLQNFFCELKLSAFIDRRYRVRLIGQRYRPVQ